METFELESLRDRGRELDMAPAPMERGVLLMGASQKLGL